MTTGVRVQVTRFAAIGALATGLHYVLLAAFVERHHWDPVVASALAFTISALANYELNRRITFGGAASHVQALPRFFLVALAGLGLNTCVMAAALAILSVHYLIAQVMATALVFLWSFTGNRLWTFR